jgi:hypothetical protein
VNFDPDFDTPDRPGLISRQEAAELAGMKAPPRQVSEHNSGLTWTYNDDNNVDSPIKQQLTRATAYMNRAGAVTWPGLAGGQWSQLGTITSDSMRFERLEPTERSNRPAPDDAATRALKARQARNTGPTNATRRRTQQAEEKTPWLNLEPLPPVRSATRKSESKSSGARRTVRYSARKRRNANDH